SGRTEWLHAWRVAQRCAGDFRIVLNHHITGGGLGRSYSAQSSDMLLLGNKAGSKWQRDFRINAGRGGNHRSFAIAGWLHGGNVGTENRERRRGPRTTKTIIRSGPAAGV